ncbi:hypothetical protein [Paracoccus zhejiangensis]|uniref:Uncharacterized protein n=1 Tax=Paracoccus zhejiangensis TaxID=1077935 RepID=A0A2H5EXM8_9RHOB|nr:hypothetical protein [Paracoccus zhejiangensis]AUH64059.1 hypothetical protein CX676_07715 [Paracoccus zhejiangensis]
MSGSSDDRNKMTPEELRAALLRFAQSLPKPKPWKPKVLSKYQDGSEEVSTHDWMRLRYENSEGGELEAARREWDIARHVAEELQVARLAGRNKQRKEVAAKTAAGILAYVRDNPRGATQKATYREDVGKACGVSGRTVFDVLKKAGITI